MGKKQVVVVSHCVLNQQAVVRGWERAQGPFPFAVDILNEKIAIIQLSCPELLFLGSQRAPLEYQDYNNLAGFRNHCQNLLVPIFQQLASYQAADYEYLGVIGIHESPNCSITKTRGVLMEEYFKLCQKNQLSERFLEVPTDYHESIEQEPLPGLAEFLH